MAETRTYVTFNSQAFNVSEPKTHYLHPNNFGDELARRLVEELSRNGSEVTGKVQQEDHGWYFVFRHGSREYVFLVGWRGGSEWLGWIERRVGLLGALFQAHKRGIDPGAVQVIQQALADAEEISDVRWHTEKELTAGRDEVSKVS